MFVKKKVAGSSMDSHNLPFLFGLIRGHGEKKQRLSKEEELKLWMVIKKEQNPLEVQSAKERIILAQYPLVAYLAKKKTRDQHIIDDLIALGFEVCLDRLACFEPARGYRFSTYVNFYVKKAIDTYYKKIRNIGITYYPLAGYTMLEFNENYYNENSFPVQTSETERLELLNKLNSLDQEEKELIERHYFNEEPLVDIARKKMSEKLGENPETFTDEFKKKYWESILKKEHDRIRQRLHRAELKLGRMINEESKIWMKS